MIPVSIDKNQTTNVPSNDSSRDHKFTKWLSPKHWVNLFESSFHARDVALVALGAEVGFVTSTLGFLSAILGGLGVFICLAVLVTLNACFAGYLIYKVMRIDGSVRNNSDAVICGATAF